MSKYAATLLQWRAEYLADRKNLHHLCSLRKFAELIIAGVL